MTPSFEAELETVRRISGMAYASVRELSSQFSAGDGGLEIALVTRYGEVVGTLCVTDDDPLPLSLAQVDLLEDIARQIADKLSASRASSPAIIHRASTPPIHY
jgi:hypothetical protein